MLGNTLRERNVHASVPTRRNAHGPHRVKMQHLNKVYSAMRSLQHKAGNNNLYHFGNNRTFDNKMERFIAAPAHVCWKQH